jgi:hypothetical protein
MIELSESYPEEDEPVKGKGKGKKVEIESPKGSRGRGSAAREVDNEEWADRVKGILYELVDAVVERL